MGLLQGTHEQYYKGNDFGNYQFVSLEDIINQFMVVYTGENKMIPYCNRIDVAFHAQRALAELSFDTFKSVKAQEIVVPNTLQMILPHDYVNYTKLSQVDSSGIKHLLYPTSKTSNPFQIRQEDNGDYSFPSGHEELKNADFSSVTGTVADDWIFKAAEGAFGANYWSSIGIDSGKLMWSYNSKHAGGGNFYGHIGIAYQVMDVSDQDYIDISADGVTSDISFVNPDATTGTAVGTVRFGISTTQPDTSNLVYHQGNITTPLSSSLAETNMFNLTNNDGDTSYIEWSGSENSTKTVYAIDVRNIDTVYAIALSFVDPTRMIQWGFSLKPASNPNGAPTGTLSTPNINSLDNVSITNTYGSTHLISSIGNEKNSSTWNNYKAITPSENRTDDYEDDVYWYLNDGQRYGLDPQHAQTNGSFYIDQRLGRIHFSSNISGKTVILDYISDSLGTDAEMQVHKFAEDAMYKWISHAIMSTSSYGQPLIPRLTKEKFAAIRKAKLRLSNIELEELTQILRGKSKQIKH